MADTIRYSTRTYSSATTNYDIDVDKILHRKFDYQTPITQFFMMNNKASAPTKEALGKFRWREKGSLLRTTTVSAITGGATSEDTITFGTANVIKLNDVIYIESTGDILWVDTRNSSTSFNVTNTVNANISAVTAETTVRVLTSAVKEDYARSVALTNEGEEKYGYTQIGLESVGMSTKEAAAARYVEEDGGWNALIDEKIEDIKKYEERKYLYNNAAYYDSTTTIGFSAGFKGAVTTNVSYYDGDLDEAELEDFLETLFAANDTSELIFDCGSKYVKQLNSFLKDVYTYNTDDYIKVYGGIAKGAGDPRLVKYMSPWGTAYFRWNPMLEGTVYSYGALATNPKHIKMRYMKNDPVGSRKFRIEPNVQDPGTGIIQDQFMWDTGLQCALETTHGWHLKRP